MLGRQQLARAPIPAGVAEHLHLHPQQRDSHSYSNSDSPYSYSYSYGHACSYTNAKVDAFAKASWNSATAAIAG